MPNIGKLVQVLYTNILSSTQSWVELLALTWIYLSMKVLEELAWRMQLQLSIVIDGEHKPLLFSSPSLFGILHFFFLL